MRMSMDRKKTDQTARIIQSLPKLLMEKARMADKSCMPSHVELKSKAFLGPMIAFLESLLDINLKRSGNNKFRSHCPFHNDRQDSFRGHVSANGEVRFRCFGECERSFDVYDLVMLRKKCSFREAQLIYAKHLGINDFKPEGRTEKEPEIAAEPESHLTLVEPIKPSAEILCAINDAAEFYHHLLLKNGETFPKVLNYLLRRGVDEKTIRDFRIGYAPSYNEGQYAGRALIKGFLDRFEKDYKTFNPFYQANLVRLLNDGSPYQRHIDFSAKDSFTRCYADYFAGRITFPVYDANAGIQAIIGRRPNNQGIRWLKQRSEGNALDTKGLLYGVDKASRHIKHYKTAILVEGIFDYFAFYKLFQDRGKPIVISTLGTFLTKEVIAILTALKVENFVVAFDWDDAGRKAIQNAARKLGARVFYLGGIPDGQDPADKLKEMEPIFSGFSLRHLLSHARRTQAQTEKPIGVSVNSVRNPHASQVSLKPVPANPAESLPVPAGLTGNSKDFVYDVDDFLSHLSYDNANKAALASKLQSIIRLLEKRPSVARTKDFFTLPRNFIVKEHHDDIGPGLMLWLRLVMEQQRRKRRVKLTDTELGQLLGTSRATISRYKQMLKQQGFLSIKIRGRIQSLSACFFPKPTSHYPTHHLHHPPDYWNTN